MTQKKIRYFLSKHAIKDVDVYTVIKEFFKEYLQAKYEFTFEELKEELKKIYLEKPVKDELFSIIDSFEAVEYKDEEVPQDTLKEILKRFDLVLEHLIIIHPKQTIIHKIIGKKPKAAPPPALPTHTERTKPLATGKDGPEVKPLAEKHKPVKAVKHEPPKVIEKASWTETEEKDAPEKEVDNSNWLEEVSVENKDPGKNVTFTELTQSSAKSDLVTNREESVKGAMTEMKHLQEEKSFKEEIPVQKASPEQNDLDTLSQELDQAITPSKDVEGMTELIQDVQSALNNKDVKTAKNVYKELLGKYNSLPEQDRHAYYGHINELYMTLMNQ